MMGKNKMSTYEKQLEGEELVVCKYDKNNNLIEYVKIHLDCEYPGWLQVDYYTPDDSYVQSSHATPQNFGVQTFEDLIELPVTEIAKVIWGED